MSPEDLQQVLRPGVWATTCIFILMALAIWTTLQASAPRRSAALWAGGACATAIWLLLLSLRPSLPEWAGYELSAACFIAGAALRGMALRMHLGMPLGARNYLLAFMAIVLTYSVLHRVGWWQARMVFGWLTCAAAMAQLTWWAWRCWQRQASRAARTLAMAEGQGALVMAVTASWQWVMHVDLLQLQNNHAVVIAVMVSLCVAGIYGNLGYLGMVLDDLQQQRAAATQQGNHALVQAAQASAREEATRKQAESLRVLTQEQDRLLQERDALLHLLAHEVRQPLHSASAVLRTLQRPTDPLLAAGHGAAQRAARADRVLGQVRDVLDNVLAASQLLDRESSLRLQPTDPALLLEITKMDLPEDQQQRVHLHDDGLPATVPMEPNLMRLCVRNLMRNALTHGGTTAQVQVRGRLLEDGTHWQLSLQDDGPGMNPDRLSSLQQNLSMRTAEHRLMRDKQAGLGLGLQIVQQVAAMHGATLNLTSTPGHGMTVALNLPLRALAETAAPPTAPD